MTKSSRPAVKIYPWNTRIKCKSRSSCKKKAWGRGYVFEWAKKDVGAKAIFVDMCEEHFLEAFFGIEMIRCESCVDWYRKRTKSVGDVFDLRDDDFVEYFPIGVFCDTRDTIFYDKKGERYCVPSNRVVCHRCGKVLVENWPDPSWRRETEEERAIWMKGESG